MCTLPASTTPPTGVRHIHRTVVPALLSLLVVLTGCTEGDPTEGVQPELGGEVTEPEQGVADAGEAQLAPGAGVGGADERAEADDRSFVDGDFGEIPVPTAAEPFGGATVEDDVVVQSFMVIATSPQEVIDFYRGELDALGWSAGQLDQSGGDAAGEEPAQIRGTFTMDDQTLLVTAARLEGDDSQLTLQLSGQ